MNIRVKTPAVEIELRKLPAFDAKVNNGLDAIPYTTFKTQNKNMARVTWWGIHVVHIEQPIWGAVEFDTFKRRFIVALNALPKGTALCTELDRIARNVSDFLAKRQRPLLIGGDSNQLINTTLGHGIQLEVLHELNLDHQSRSYGGYFGFVDVLGSHKPFLVYHRGVTLYNYMQRDEIAALIAQTLHQQFELVFPEQPKLRVGGRVERQRCGTIIAAPETILVKRAAPVAALPKRPVVEAKSGVG